MTRIEALGAGSHEDARSESNPAFKPSEESNTIVWQPGEIFQPEIVNAVFATEAKHTQHLTYGDGFAWEFAVGREFRSLLEIYSELKLARVRLADGPTEYQSREYIIDTIMAHTSSSTGILSISSTMWGRYSTVNIYRRGDIDEIHRFRKLPESSPKGFLWQGEQAIISHENESGVRRTFTIQEAAELIGCHPSNIKYLIGVKRLPAFKRGYQWFVDSEAVEAYKPTPRILR